MPDEQGIRSEFIPLGYSKLGEVVDTLGNIRIIEAIPYALDNVYIRVYQEGSALEISREILDQVKQTMRGKLRSIFKKDLEGRVGFITRKNENVEDSDGEGEWFAVQLYRIKD